MRLQSSLGRIHYLPHRSDLDMAGYLTVAKVLKVHHKTGTADIQILNTQDTFVSSEANEGFYSARIIQPLAGYDENRKKSWGTVLPIQEGSYVLVTFLDQMKNRPVIIGQVPRVDNSENVFTPYYPLRANLDGFDKQEALKYVTVYPSQAYTKIDGESNIEFSHASKSFFVMFNESKYPSFTAEDGHLAFDHEDLTEIDAQTGKPYETDIPNAQQPANLLYVHRTAFDDEKTTWTKVFIDSNGMLRITRDNRDDKLTYLEISPEGTLKIRRQLDSPEHGEGSNYSEITQAVDGSITMKRSVGEKWASMSLTNTGEATIEHSSGSFITVDEHLYLESSETGEIQSESLSKFIEKNHMVISDTEPKNPQPYLLWIDTSS
jgi:hypothetical protein